jgi:hypothetical protein
MNFQYVLYTLLWFNYKEITVVPLINSRKKAFSWNIIETKSVSFFFLFNCIFLLYIYSEKIMRKYHATPPPRRIRLCYIIPLSNDMRNKHSKSCPPALERGYYDPFRAGIGCRWVIIGRHMFDPPSLDLHHGTGGAHGRRRRVCP